MAGATLMDTRNSAASGNGSTLFSALGGWLGDRFSKDPSKIYEQGMQPGINQIREGVGRATSYLDPYRTGGMEALDRYMGMLNKYNDPMQHYNDIMSGWNMSPGMNNRLKGALDTVQNQLAARGMTNSGQEMTDLAKTTSDYIGEDQRNYLNDILGMEHTGMTGYGDISHMGEGAATTSGGYEMQGANDIASMYNAIALAKANEAANRRRSNRDVGTGIGGWFDKGIDTAGSMARMFGGGV